MESHQTKPQATLKENSLCKIVELCGRYNIPSGVDELLSKGYESTEITLNQKTNLSQAVRSDNPDFEELNRFLRSLVKNTDNICVLTKFLENCITQNSHDKQMVRANLQTIKHKLEADIITLTVNTVNTVMKKTVMINTPIVKKYLMCWYVLNEYVNWMSKDTDAKS